MTELNQNNNNEKISELDFLKLNETLANEQFANWYYNQITAGTDVNLDIMGFVDIVKKYSEGKYE